ncbi:uncharacterized protein [Anabrus simplex]|uniref:uncharacterized protein n=1 Tax=Anabrus simplex TaxID=316456 RepID=UPI0035A2D4DE
MRIVMMGVSTSNLYLIVLLLYHIAIDTCHGQNNADDRDDRCPPEYNDNEKKNGCVPSGLRTWSIIGVAFSGILLISICCSLCRYCMQERVKNHQQQRRGPNAIVAVITPANERPAFRTPNINEWQYTAPPPPYTLYNLYPEPSRQTSTPPTLSVANLNSFSSSFTLLNDLVPENHKGKGAQAVTLLYSFAISNSLEHSPALLTTPWTLLCMLLMRHKRVLVTFSSSNAAQAVPWGPSQMRPLSRQMQLEHPSLV